MKQVTILQMGVSLITLQLMASACSNPSYIKQVENNQASNITQLSATFPKRMNLLDDAINRIPREILEAAMSHGNEPNDQGFVGPNKKLGVWIDINSQKDMGSSLSIAVAISNQDKIKTYLHALDLTLARMNENGSFEINPKYAKDTIGNRVNGIFAFSAEIVPALMQLVVKFPEYRREVENYSLKFKKMADFSLPYWQMVVDRSPGTTNWILRDAMTWEYFAKFLDDENYLQPVKTLLSEAYARQLDNGVLLEQNGADTTYQTVSIRHLGKDDMIRPSQEVKAHLVLAMKWYLTKIRDDGKIDVCGNSRTGVGHVNRFGEVKNGNSPLMTLLAFATTREVSDDAELNSELESAMNRFITAAYDKGVQRDRSNYIFNDCH